MRCWLLLTVLNLVVSMPQLLAQVDTGDALEAQRDSLSTLDSSMQQIQDATIRISSSDSGHAGIGKQALLAGGYEWSKDSITLLEYHHVGEIAAAHPASQLYHLGNYGQPAWLGLGGSAPVQSSLTVDGLLVDHLPTSLPDLYRVSTEDATRFTVYPQYQAFWYGAPGDVTVIDVERKTWDAPRPFTRLRHTESANEYLYTDGMFTLNPSAGSNIFLALTRTSIGSSSSNNAARFANNRHESWNARAAYRSRVSGILTLSGRVQYDEHLTLLNGGIRGDFDALDASSPYRFEEENAGEFSATAFDPKAASLVNETMYSEGQHYSAEAAALLNWDADSTQATQIRLLVDSDVRRFRDNAAAVNTELTLAEPQLNLSDHSALYQAVLDHTTHLDWAELTLQGAFGGYAVEMGGEALDDADVLAHARGKLSLFLGPVSIAGFGRLDQRFGSSTVSFGAGGELPIGPIVFWGGTSFSARPRSPIELYYTGHRVFVTGDRSPDLDKAAIAEGGVRFAAESVSLDLRGFARNESRYTILRGLSYSDSILGRYTLFVDEIPGGASRTLLGGSVDARMKLWRLHLDQRASYLTSDTDRDLLPAPEFSYTGELYYRGGLIEGTLDLRVGARFSYSSQFLPLVYHAEAGMFVSDRTIHPGLTSYTDVTRIDLFLFATIKQSATIHLVLHNLLDDQNISTEFYPTFDRSFRLGVDWIFTD